MGKVDSLSKPKGGIRKHKHRGKQPQKSRKRSFFTGIWDYLTSDGFMYGPLLSKRWHSPAPRLALGADGEKRSKPSSPVRILKDFMFSREAIMKGAQEPVKKVIDQLEKATDAGGKVVSKSNSPVRILKNLIGRHEGVMKAAQEPIKKVIDQLEEASDTGGKVVLQSNSPAGILKDLLMGRQEGVMKAPQEPIKKVIDQLEEASGTGGKVVLKSNSPAGILRDLMGRQEGVMKAAQEPIKKVIDQLEEASDTSGKLVLKSNSPAGILKDFMSFNEVNMKAPDEPINKIIDQLEAASETGGRVVQMTVHQTITTTTTVGGGDKADQQGSEGEVRSQDLSTPMSVDVRGDTEQEGDADDEHWWGTDGHEDEHDFHDSIPLDDAAAEKVAHQLVECMGGRFSNDLGINVHVGINVHQPRHYDDEVECWFLAANLFCRNVSFDVSKKTYKELSEAGVKKTVDLLSLEESKVADILESTGFTKYGRRVASQWRKMAIHLEENYGGRVSTFQLTADNQDLVRHLRSLPGVKLSTARIFLRELRGLWIGATLEFDGKSKRAAMHLKLLGSMKASSHPESVLSEFAQSTGIDVRDLEVALFKLGSAHEQHYGECPGGIDCRALLPTDNLFVELSTPDEMV